MAPRLKVFRWSDGFHAYSVAVSSRPKALSAWGSDQDLFATGLASEIKDGPDYDAALKAPGEVIRRGEVVDVGKIEKARKPVGPKPPSAAQVRKVQALEEALRQIAKKRAATLGGLDDEIKALQTRRTIAEADFRDRTDQAAARLRKARGL